MGGIGVQSRVPHHADREVRCRYRQLESYQTLPRQLSLAQTGTRYQRNKIRMARNVQAIKKTWYDRHDFALQTEFNQGVVDRAF